VKDNGQFQTPRTNSPTVAYAADAAPGMMKMASALVDSDSEVGGGPEAVGSTEASSSPNSLAWASLRTRYCRPPTAGEHVVQIVFHCDVPRHRPPAVIRRCRSIPHGDDSVTQPGFVVRKHIPRAVHPPVNHGGVGELLCPSPNPARDFRSRIVCYGKSVPWGATGLTEAGDIFGFQLLLNAAAC
jgi:hypothetical protein